ncbi:MAG: hypothetical protein QM831_12745 [Kofleriaceae bacterium]
MIHEFASRLYRRAARIAVMCAFLGFVIGAGAALPLSPLFAPHSHGDSGSSIFIVVGIVGAVFGWVIGTERAFALRLMAQTALCQAQIERNTRTVR